MIKLILLNVLFIPTLVLAEIWNCEGIFSNKPKDSNCSLVKNASTKCINGGFRKISLVKKGEPVVEEKCARVTQNTNVKKPVLNRESLKTENGYLDIEKYEEEQKIARLAVDDPLAFSRHLSRPTEEDDRFFESSSGMDMNQAREDLKSFKQGEIPEDYQ